MKVPTPETVTEAPATAVRAGDPPAGDVTVSVPPPAEKVSTEMAPDLVPHVAVIWVVTMVSWMWAATEVASEAGHCHDPAASSWRPRKCATRQDATASVGDHDVPASALATSLNRVGTA